MGFEMVDGSSPRTRHLLGLILFIASLPLSTPAQMSRPTSVLFHRNDSGSDASTATSSDCPKSCSSNGRCLPSGECACYEGFMGSDCGKNAVECVAKGNETARNGTGVGRMCGDHGRCLVGGVCACRDGWSGWRCKYEPCPSLCSERGLCYHNTTGESRCLCMPGYTGEACEKEFCPNGCSQHGVCVIGGKHDFHCHCTKGWTGKNCQQRTCEHDCGEHGVCVRRTSIENATLLISANSKAPYQLSLPASRLGERYQCHCHEGWGGPACGQRICADTLGRHFNCSGRGICQENATCRCSEGYFGKHCEHSYEHCPKECGQAEGRGMCTTHGCRCARRFGGPDCSKTCPQKCMDQGLKCVNGECQCPPGLEGESCEFHKCRKPCLNDGVCFHGSCLCRTPYTGSHCQMRVCAGDCSGRGQCIDGTCHCKPGYSGEACELKNCPNMCTSPERGACNSTSGECICNSPFTGLACEHKGCDKECSFHGDCIDNKCKCDPGWEGKDCEIRTVSASHHRITSLPVSGMISESTVCKSDNDCLARIDRGLCVGGTCKCDERFWGEGCQHRTCSAKNAVVDIGPNQDVYCMGRGQCTEVNGIYNATRSYLCACEQGFFGKHCEHRTGCPNQCSSKGICLSSGECECVSPYYGVDCSLKGLHNSSNSLVMARDGSGDMLRSVSIHHTQTFPRLVDNDTSCLDGCSDHGICQNAECFCEEGWEGVRCEVKSCPNHCSGHGECLNFPDPTADDGLGWRCKCDQDRKGKICEEEVNMCPAHNCSGRGECLQTTGGGFFCECYPGYSGPGCEDTICNDKCSNHGVCLNSACYCDRGYIGPHCEMEVCPNKCSGHGSCHIDPSKSPVSNELTDPQNPVGCLCDKGWGGPACSKPLSDLTHNPSLACPNSCSHHGTCERLSTGIHVCRCDSDYLGSDCSKPVCNGGCGIHGACVAPEECECAAGFEGKNCEIEICPNSCSNRGLCNPSRRRCECLPGYSGADCSRSVACRPGADGKSGCSMHGLCVGGQCRCSAGWFGGFCEFEWCPKGCGQKEGRGKCQTDGSCKCKNGYFGRSCQFVDKAICLVACDVKCTKYKGPGLHTGSRVNATYDPLHHTIRYATKYQCFQMCAGECDAALALLGDGDGLADPDGIAASKAREEAAAANSISESDMRATEL
ncbi:hypothetical protein AAMO2058_000212700 [Amorphochlora amoebiformis]